jgi:hypothetical protein
MLADPVAAKTTTQLLIENAPAILIAVSSVIGALQAFRNGQKADAAATAAATAAVKTEQVHQATVQLGVQAQAIRTQTDGQLSRVLGTNEALHELLTKMIAIVSAREGRPVAVRTSDVADAPVNLTVPEIPSKESVQADLQRRSTDAPKEEG